MDRDDPAKNKTFSKIVLSLIVNKQEGDMLLKNRVVGNKQVASGIYRMTIESPEVVRKAVPGQFVHVKCGEGNSTILRRPISIYRASEDEGTIEIIYQVRGKGTELLSMMKTGDIVDFMGPLGRGFDLTGEQPGREPSPVRLDNIAVVGGGIGIFPLMFLLEESRAAAKHVLLGFKNRNEVILKNEFEAVGNLSIATDDGSEGYNGFVTELLEENINDIRPQVIYACGPLPMLAKTADIAQRYGIPCQVSMEQRMACGVGACLGCAVKIKQGDEWAYKHVCKDGPVFWADEVIFEGGKQA